MRIGINGSSQVLFGVAIDDIARHAAEAEEQGFASYWLNQTSGTDALTVLAVVGHETERIGLGTAVVHTWARHPEMLAGQSLTVQAASGNRFQLGVGLAHQPSVEGRYKIPFEKPVRHMREYLSILVPLIEKRSVDFEGEIWSCATDFTVPPADPCPVLVAALGPQMLRLAGRMAAGTVLWLVGPRTVAEHIAPTINGAAEEAGRPARRIVASLPICVTDDVQGMRGTIGEILAGYNDLPSYRAMLDREGAEGPADVAIVGDEAKVNAELDRLAEAGTTEFAAVEVARGEEEQQRTRELLRARL